MWYDIEAAEIQEGFLSVFDFIAYPSSEIQFAWSDIEAAEIQEGFLCLFGLIAYARSEI